MAAAHFDKELSANGIVHPEVVRVGDHTRQLREREDKYRKVHPSGQCNESCHHAPRPLYLLFRKAPILTDVHLHPTRTYDGEQ
jgi:hypothetical protein